MADSAIRQLAILEMLPRYPNSRTTSEICKKVKGAGYEVSSKTVERDLQALESQFALICDTSTKPYRWCFQKQAVVNIPGMSIEMALTFNLVEKYTQAYLPGNIQDYLSPYFIQAGKTLSSLTENRLTKWKKKVHVIHDWLTLLPPKHNQITNEIIYESVLREKKIKAKYRPRAKALKDYELNPLGLVFKGELTYLLCTAGKHGTVLHFLLNRFTEVVITNEDIEELAREINVDDYISKGAFGNLESDQPIQLKLKILKVKGYHLHETPLSKNQKIVDYDNDYYLLTATVPDSKHILWWILSLGDRAEVLEPLSLRHEIASQAKNMALMYEGCKTV